MKNLIALAVIAMAVVTAVACTSKKQEEAPAAPKSLVLYYSQSGTTKQVAEEIQRLTGADIETIDVEEPYDGDFGATVMRMQKENAENILPKVKPLNVNIADYDIVYLGYPIWGGTYAAPVKALLKEQDFAGKKVVPFCSFGSGGLETSAKDLKEALPKAEILNGYGVRTARIGKIAPEIDRFLKENGLIEGEVEALPEFSEQQPVGELEKSLFAKACGNYMFPLGNPVTFGKRTVGDTTEYEFKTDQNTTIYVVEEVKEGDMVTVEFTRVVR